MYQANAHVGQEGLDGQISTSVCTGIKSDRDLVAFHEILLATVFGLYLFPMFICGGRRDSHTYCHGLYDQFSSSVGYSKHCVLLLGSSPLCLAVPLICVQLQQVSEPV